MHKRFFAFLACLGLLLCCGGCQLADPEQSQAQEPEQDRLIGVFATEEYLDLFDIDAYISDNADQLVDGGGTVVSSQDSEAYEGRIWAERTDDNDWVFRDLEGMGYYAYRYGSEAENGIATHMDEGLTGNGVHVTSTDEGESVELEATIYHVSGNPVQYCFNPVYQTPDGAVYLTSGNGVTLGNAAEGEACTHTLSDSVTTTDADGKTSIASCSVAVRVEIMNAPEKIVILQMDGDSRVLDRAVYDPDRVPASLAPEPECAYLIVETHKTGPDGEIVTRTVADAGAERFSTFRARSDGVCAKQDTALTWPKEADI